MNHATNRLAAAAVLAALILGGCRADSPRSLNADGSLIHLDDHLADAIVIGSEAPADFLRSEDWDDARLLAEWGSYEGEGRTPWLAEEPGIVGAGDGALRITADERHRAEREWFSTVATTPVDGWLASDWSHVLVRARTEGPIDRIGFIVGRDAAIQLAGGAPAISDGQVHTYRFDLPSRLKRTIAAR